MTYMFFQVIFRLITQFMYRPVACLVHIVLLHTHHPSHQHVQKPSTNLHVQNKSSSLYTQNLSIQSTNYCTQKQSASSQHLPAKDGRQLITNYICPNRRNNHQQTSKKKHIKKPIDSTKLKTKPPPKQTLQTLSVPPSFFAKAAG